MSIRGLVYQTATGLVMGEWGASGSSVGSLGPGLSFIETDEKAAGNRVDIGQDPPVVVQQTVELVTGWPPGSVSVGASFIITLAAAAVVTVLDAERAMVYQEQRGAGDLELILDDAGSFEFSARANGYAKATHTVQAI